MYKITAIILFFVITTWLYFSNQKTATNTPQSSYNHIQTDFDKLISSKQMDISDLTFNPYNHKIFFTFFSDNQPTTVILSDQKNVWLQLNALQKINKMVKIKNGSLQLVDLSLKHPYATIKNH